MHPEGAVKACSAEVELLAGAGWGHEYWNKGVSPYYAVSSLTDPKANSDYNYFMTILYNFNNLFSSIFY